MFQRRLLSVDARVVRRKLTRWSCLSNPRVAACITFEPDSSSTPQAPATLLDKLLTQKNPRASLHFVRGPLAAYWRLSPQLPPIAVAIAWRQRHSAKYFALANQIPNGNAVEVLALCSGIPAKS